LLASRQPVMRLRSPSLPLVGQHDVDHNGSSGVGSVERKNILMQSCVDGIVEQEGWP
jgi:hypothetical protein